MNKLICSIVLILIAGCVSNQMPKSEREAIGNRVIVRATDDLLFATLAEDFKYRQAGGQGILGDMVYTLKAGDYTLYGSDGEGQYYKHSRSGVVRSGNLGMYESGGFYIPDSDDSGRWGIWIVAKGNDVLVGVLGPGAGVGRHSIDQSITVTYCSNISEEEVGRLKSLLVGTEESIYAE